MFSCEPKESKISVVLGCICPLWTRQLGVGVGVGVWETIVNKGLPDYCALPINRRSLAGNSPVLAELCVYLSLQTASPRPVSVIPLKCDYGIERLAGPFLHASYPPRAHTRSSRFLFPLSFWHLAIFIRAPEPQMTHKSDRFTSSQNHCGATVWRMAAAIHEKNPVLE